MLLNTVPIQLHSDIRRLQKGFLQLLILPSFSHFLGFQWPHVWRVGCSAPDLLEKYLQWLSTVLDRAHCHSLAICVHFVQNISYNAEDFVTFIQRKLFVLMPKGNVRQGELFTSEHML